MQKQTFVAVSLAICICLFAGCSTQQRTSISYELGDKENKEQMKMLGAVNMIEYVYNLVINNETEMKDMKTFGFDPTGDGIRVSYAGRYKKIPYSFSKYSGPEALPYLYGDTYQITIGSSEGMEEINSEIRYLEAWKFSFINCNIQKSRIYFSTCTESQSGYKVDIVFIFSKGTITQKSFNGGTINSSNENRAFGSGVIKPFRRIAEKGAGFL